MKDRYGRTVDYMRISITDRCNLRCNYCMPDGIPLAPMADILTYEEIELICRTAAEAGIKKFKITGGEPLVRPGCTDLIRKIKNISGVEQVTLTTNGVFLEECLLELVKNGLDAVNVSLDTLKPEVYQLITGRDELLKVLKGITLAVEAGIPVKINSVLQRGLNASEWKDLAELTMKNPVDVRFIEMMPIGCGKEYETIYNKELLDKLMIRYPEISEDRQIHGNGPAVYYRIPGARGSIGFISAMHGKFCGSCNRIRLTSQGKIKPCLCFAECVDLKEILRSGCDVKTQLKKAIQSAVDRKPESHRFESVSEVTEQKKMVQIGG